MRLPEKAVVLAVDETILRLFPPLRAAWSKQGTQAEVEITGNNARRVLFGAINIRTGHRSVMAGHSMRQEEFQRYLRDLRRRYRDLPLYLLLDKHGAHKAPKSVRLARQLNIRLVWLPTQSPELNAMDHLWRALKAKIAANRQYDTVDDLAAIAAQWIQSLTALAALRLAGLHSKNNWLRRFSQNFCGPT